MVAMTDDAAARADFDRRLDALLGRRVLAVDYWDVHNFGPEPAEWDYGDWHHAVMGVELMTDAGPVTVTWTTTFTRTASRSSSIRSTAISPLERGDPNASGRTSLNGTRFLASRSEL